MNYVPLRCHSNYSFLYAPLSLERLIAAASALDHRTLALTDADGLYGAIEFYTVAKETGLKPIIGCEMETEAGRVVFLAKDMTGYGNLCRLSTINMYHQRVPTLDEIARYAQGLVLICLDTEHVWRLKDIFADDLYIGLESFDDIPTRRDMREKIRIAREFGMKITAADPAYFADQADVGVHRALAAIKYLKTIDDLGRQELANPQAVLRGAWEIAARYRDVPEALAATGEIAEKCELELPVDRLNFPAYEGLSDVSNYQLLRRKSEAGLRSRYRRLTGEVYSQFESELAVIERTGFVDYFMIVSEIIDFCKNRGIPVVGRGSAASSIISYALGITEVDPIAQNLYFARFLNEARSDPPDIDIDLCWRRRDEVLDFVYEKYGRNRVAMICTLNTFAARGAIRELGKVFGLSGDEISDFTKRLPWGHLGDLESTRRKYPECRNLPLDKKPYRSIIELAHRIEGYPRHLSIHCGGTVIAPGELLDLVPLEMSAKGIAITQYDMHSIAKLGLVKIDLLGQRGLSTIVDGEQFAKRKTGRQGPSDQPVSYDYNDLDTFALLRAGRTIGVFQIESPGLRALLIEIQPKGIDDITLALALIRPGAAESGMKKLFLERLAGQKPVEYLHPLLEPVLAETLGNIVYQEQVLRTAEALAGFTPGQADLLRRAITRNRDRREFQSFADRFVAQAAGRGVPRPKAEEVFALLSRFAGYGFCKAHAATYAVLSYRGSYLKAHHPVEYMAAMLNNFCGYYRPFVYADEARRFGARLKPPSVDEPSDLCTVDDSTITIGLAFVKNLSAITRERIIEERKHRAFASLGDFLVRVRPSRTEAESLVRVGAFDYLKQTRPAHLWYLKLYGDKILKSPPQTPLLGAVLPPRLGRAEFAPRLGDYNIDEKLAAEEEILEMAISCHPTERIAVGNSHVHSCELAELDGRPVKIIGQVIDRKRIQTSNGKLMVFLTMEDAFDYFEVTLFPAVYQKYGQRIFKKPLLEVSGTVESQRGVVTITADKVEAIT